MSSSESREPLSPELMQRLRAVDVGERVRQIRMLRGINSQTELLKVMEAATGTTLSKAWLSGIESGQLPLTAERRQDLARALELTGSEVGLLETEASSVEPSPAMRRYAAWQSVRLMMADEMVRVAPDAAARARGRAVMSRLHDALDDDEDVRHASGRRISRLDQFGDLPEATRWMLVIEAAFMVPFHPFEPFDMSWEKSRVRMLEPIVSDLGLGDHEEHLRQIELIRHQGITTSTYWRNRELKDFERDPAGLSRSVLGAGDSEERYTLLRGGSLVGGLGWDYCCGIHLVRGDRPSPAAREDPLSMLNASVPMALTGSGVLSPFADLSAAGLVGNALASGLKWRAARKKQLSSIEQATTMRPEPFWGTPALLMGLRPMAVHHELAKLDCLSRLRDSARQASSWNESEGLPTSPEIAERLRDLADSLLLQADGRAELDMRSSLAIEGMNETRELLMQYAERIAKA